MIYNEIYNLKLFTSKNQYGSKYFIVKWSVNGFGFRLEILLGKNYIYNPLLNYFELIFSQKVYKENMKIAIKSMLDSLWNYQGYGTPDQNNSLILADMVSKKNVKHYIENFIRLFIWHYGRFLEKNP